MYRAAIVGCGRIGCAFDDDPRRGYVSTHAGAYKRTPGVELVALSDIDAARLHKYADKFDVRGRYIDFRDMLATERVDILSICTGAGTHRELVDAGVEAGVEAIFCEKPLATNLSEADAILRRCADAGVMLMVDHQRRFDRFHGEVARYIRENGLGRIQQATCYYTSGIANNGSHMLDLLRFFFGDAEWVQGAMSANPSPNPQDANVDGMVKFTSGVLATLQACDVTKYAMFETTVLGSRGRLAIKRFGFEAHFEEARPSPQFVEYNELVPAPPPIDASGTREYMLQAIAHLVHCLEHNQQPRCTGEDGRRTLELVFALWQSAQNGGCRVSMPLASSSLAIQSR
jgi:predicted dehydrogenase